MIEPIVQAHGLELVTADLIRGRGPWELRVTVDTPAGDGHVSIDACAALSREIGTHLDSVDAIPVRYKLEVGSPGLDRRLGREKDFVHACGAEVALETRRPIDGRRRFRGRLVRFDEGVATVCVDGRDYAVPFDEIGKAHTVYQFTRADFAKK
ncbi:MAG TPA: ribosome maturation factor RimP [Myxococcota bacterium]|nr:ribosome maturation factor RimP [Myxococcota bacterium]